MRPLAGLRVLDLSRVVAGPIAGRVLADLGADVVKVEPPEGDLSRFFGEVLHGLSGFYTQQNAGKRNVCVDLKAGGAAGVILRLAAAADVLLENFRPGVLDRLGLTWEALHAANPRLVMLSITGYGQTGPERDRMAYAPVVQAETGLVERQARFDAEPPSDPMISIADMTAGLHGVIALLAALRQRDLASEGEGGNGLGQRIDIALFDSLLFSDDYTHHAADRSPVVRLGGEVWDVPGGPLMVAGTFRATWAVLRDAVALPDPAPPDADLPTKIALRRQAVADWFADFPDRATALHTLESLGIAYGHVRTSEEAVHGEQAIHRGVLAEVDDRGGGTRKVVQSPYRFSTAESGVARGAPHQGEHNAEVLAEWCGMAEHDITALVKAGTLLVPRRDR